MICAVAVCASQALGRFKFGGEEGTWGAHAGLGTGGSPVLAVALCGCSVALRLGFDSVKLASLDVPAVTVNGLLPGSLLMRPAWRESVVRASPPPYPSLRDSPLKEARGAVVAGAVHTRAVDA